MSDYQEHGKKAGSVSSKQTKSDIAVKAQAQAPELSHNWKRIIVTIWIGQAFSILTAYSSMYAGVWYVTETTDSALMLAIASLCSMLPQGLLSPIGGVVADRFNRKYVLMAADAFVGVMALLMGMIIFMGHVSVGLGHERIAQRWPGFPYSRHGINHAPACSEASFGAHQYA